jgi:hypothetical protein
MYVAPMPTKVTSPLALTDAIATSLDRHVTARPMIGNPLTSRVAASRLTVVPRTNTLSGVPPVMATLSTRNSGAVGASDVQLTSSATTRIRSTRRT